jgi:hypothetical protein
MCSPLAVISVGATIAGASAQAKGQKASGLAQKQTYDYKAGVNENNKLIAEWKAQDALDRGFAREQLHRSKTFKLKGRQRAVIASRGIEVDTGSALEIAQDTAILSEIDALTIRSNAERESYESEVDAMNLGAQAEVNRMSGNNALTAGNMNAKTSLLSGIGSVASKWYMFTK